ncbi:MAG: hypothetical protein EWM72_01246 [Nitrospira sp.]|nr:MAG: hypothetical protein EWM72_01246 [Nitrospira sp.]
MPARFLELEPDRRALAFEQAGTQRGVHPGIVEKDFWVTWLLKILFSHGELGPHLVFKGGTCLSKVFGVIDRFSEDLDISVAPEFVGCDTTEIKALTSRSKRDRAMRQMQDNCIDKARSTIVPLMEAAAVELLGPPKSSWITFEVDPQSQSPTLLFHYPTHTAGLDYIRRAVKVELGSLTDQEPTRRAPVRPWVADAYPQLFPDWTCEVTALELSRSFWEKATILHSEFHRPADQATPDRYARHYSDVARLLVLPDAAAFLQDRERCARVAQWKALFYARAWARYDLACHGSFRLVPADARKAALQADYETMQPMFLTQPPPFKEVLERLASAEENINGQR